MKQFYGPTMRKFGGISENTMYFIDLFFKDEVNTVKTISSCNKNRE